MYESVAIKKQHEGEDEEIGEDKITTATGLPNNTDMDHIIETQTKV